MQLNKKWIISCLVRLRQIILFMKLLFRNLYTWKYRCNPPEVFLWKSVLKTRSKFTGEHPYRSVIFNQVAKQLYWNHTSTWVFSCKFAAYLFLRTPLTGCFSIFIYQDLHFFSVCNIKMSNLPNKGNTIQILNVYKS